MPAGPATSSCASTARRLSTAGEPRRHAPDGGRQRDARLVLGRRALPRRSEPRSRTGWRWSARAPRSSTSAANRRAPAPSRSPPRRSCAACSPSCEGLAGAARAAGPQISIDTRKAAVARAALEAGASARQRRQRPARRPRRWRRSSPSAASTCCLMHMRGEPRDDAGRAALRRRRRRRQGVPRGAPRVRRCAPGIARERILLDPGIGFGKTEQHNLELLRRLDELRALGRRS